jgi:hypothetical protein
VKNFFVIITLLISNLANAQFESDLTRSEYNSEYMGNDFYAASLYVATFGYTVSFALYYDKDKHNLNPNLNRDIRIIAISTTIVSGALIYVGARINKKRKQEKITFNLNSVTFNF